MHAQVASADAALLQKLSGHALDEVDRNTEGHAAVAATVRGDGGVDADDFAVHVDERPAAGAGIDGRVGLQEILDPDGAPEADLAALAGADDAVRHGLVQAKRAAHRQDPLTHANALAVSQRHRGQVADVELQQGHVRLRIRPDAAGMEKAAVSKVDGNLVRRGLRDYVIVGQHKGLLLAGEAHEHAGSGFFQRRRLGSRRPGRLGRLDIDHGR